MFYAISKQFLKKKPQPQQKQNPILTKMKTETLSKIVISYLSVHNITSVAYWQKQLRWRIWRTRLGNSPGYPGLPTVIIKQRPHRLPLDKTTQGWLLFPQALTLDMPWFCWRGRHTSVKPSLCPVPSHPTPSLGKETQGTELGRNHNRTPSSTSRGPDLPNDTEGMHPLFFQRAGIARKTAWRPLMTLCSDAPDLISCQECSSLINSTTLVWRFLFCCVEYR